MDDARDPRLLASLGIEVWRPSPPSPYEASNLGRIRSARGVAATHLTPKGYRVVGKYQVHRLVLTAFDGPQPPNVWGLHGDDNRSNNALTNLSWGTPRQNVRQAVLRGRLRSRAGAVVKVPTEELDSAILAVVEGRMTRAEAAASARRSVAWVDLRIRERKYPHNRTRQEGVTYEEALRLSREGAEVWVLAVGPGNVEVSNLGRVREASTGKRISTSWSRRKGYLRVFGSQLHTVVMNSFSERPFPDAIVLHHEENDRTNNSLANLRWGTYKENGADTARHGRSLRGQMHPRTKLTDETVEEGLRKYARGEITQADLSRKWGGLGQGNVSSIVRGKAWKHVARPAELDTAVDRRVGANHHLSRLTDEKVAEALRLAAEKGWGAPALAEYLGVSLGTGTQILTGKTWTHIPRPSALAEQVAARKFRLDDARVEEALRLAADNGWTGAQLAEHLGVSPAVGGNILGGRAWAHVPRPAHLAVRSVAPSLTDEQVLDGLVQAKANGWGATALGEYLGVGRGVAHKILKGTGYKHVPRP